MLIKLIVSLLYTEIVTSSLPAVFSTSTIQSNTQFSTSILHTTTIATLPTQLYIVTSTADIGSSDPPTQLYTITSTTDIGLTLPTNIDSSSIVGGVEGSILVLVIIVFIVIVSFLIVYIKHIKRSNNAHLHYSTDNEFEQYEETTLSNADCKTNRVRGIFDDHKSYENLTEHNLFTTSHTGKLIL